MGKKCLGTVKTVIRFFAEHQKEEKPIERSVDDKMASFVESMTSRDPHDVYSTAAPRSKMLR